MIPLAPNRPLTHPHTGEDFLLRTKDNSLLQPLATLPLLIALAISSFCISGCNQDSSQDSTESSENSLSNQSLDVSNFLRINSSTLVDFSPLERHVPYYDQRNSKLSPAFWQGPGHISQLCVPTSSSMGLVSIMRLMGTDQAIVSESALETAPDPAFESHWRVPGTLEPYGQVFLEGKDQLPDADSADLNERVASRIEHMATLMNTSSTQGTGYFGLQNGYLASHYFNASATTLSPGLDKVVSTSDLSVSDLFVNILNPQLASESTATKFGLPVMVFGNYIARCEGSGALRTCSFTRSGGHAVLVTGYKKINDDVYFSIHDPMRPDILRYAKIEAMPAGAKFGRGTLRFANENPRYQVIEGFSAILFDLPKTIAGL